MFWYIAVSKLFVFSWGFFSFHNGDDDIHALMHKPGMCLQSKIPKKTTQQYSNMQYNNNKRQREKKWSPSN